MSKGQNVVRMEGQRIGALVVLRRAPSERGKAKWFCRCDCGMECSKFGYLLRQQRVKSCGIGGCQWWNFLPPGNMRAHPLEWSSWASMIERCKGLEAKTKRNYLDRGITVCERWKDFKNFFVDMGKRPTRAHTIDRYPDNNGNYEPGNCRWATKKQQAQNTRSNIFVDFMGEKIKLSELSDKITFEEPCVRGRLKNCWTLLEALCIPINKYKRKRQKKNDFQS